MDPEQARQPERRTRWSRLGLPLALVAVVGLGLGLRLDGLGERMLSHPENFAPGLPMPEWVRFPPPRHDLVAVLKGTLIDGHPPTYFVALLAWTKAFGASLVSLRLPSALLGALSILLVYRLALRAGGRWTALLAAALLALNGHHVFWSQMARMYVPVAFLGLLSTLFLVRLGERGGRANQLAYLGTTTLALWSHLYAWPLVFAQIVATSARAIRERRAPEALRTQWLAVVAGLPTVQLSLFQNPPSRWHDPFGEYFGFGYLFYSRARFLGEPPEALLGAPWLIALGVVLVALASRVPRRAAVGPGPRPAPPGPWRALEWCIALGTTAALAGFATYTLSRPKADPLQMWAPVLVPIAAVLALPWVERRAAAIAVRPPGWLARLTPDLPLCLVLAVLPILCMAAVSIARGALVARGTVVFLPFLAITVALGLEALLRVRPVGVPAVGLVIALHVASVGYFQRSQSSPHDYRGLAQRIDADARPTDLILVKNDFSYPPLIYYLRQRADQMVYEEYASAVERALGGSRVWLVHLTNAPVSEEMLAAVAGMSQESAVEVDGARALLYSGLRSLGTQ